MWEVLDSTKPIKRRGFRGKPGMTNVNRRGELGSPGIQKKGTIMSQDVKTYYENYDEGRRLSRDNAHKIEFLTTVHYLNKLLPPGSCILDACAAEGEYAFYLAKQGHEVFACDLVNKHVAAMKANPKADKLAGVEVANVLDLSQFDDERFDVVLCMGALYHLFEPAEREKCIEECLRVLKYDGIAAFAYINRHAMYINHIAMGKSSLEFMNQLRDTGKNLVFYGMDFGEIQALAAKFPLTKIADVAIDGLSYPLAESFNNATDEEFAAYMDYHLEICEEPSIRGFSMHGLWIGKKE